MLRGSCLRGVSIVFCQFFDGNPTIVRHRGGDALSFRNFLVSQESKNLLRSEWTGSLPFDFQEPFLGSISNHTFNDSVNLPWRAEKIRDGVEGVLV